MSGTGKCVVCGATGSSGSICAQCGDPNKIIFVCECGFRKTLEENEPILVLLRRDRGPNIIGPGLTIKSDGCSNCKKQSTKFVLLRVSEYLQ